MTIMRKYNYLTRKEMQGTELAGKEKQSIKLSMATYICTFLIQKKLQQWEKDT